MPGVNASASAPVVGGGSLALASMPNKCIGLSFESDIRMAVAGSQWEVEVGVWLCQDVSPDRDAFAVIR